ncbi:Leucine-rich repeat-containing protein 72 [Trichoplax sp. H2]|uniref:U2A'/phosphoprotein 32 family A C-terminal domain-containing protein n=1 Tax=Trichoplax adhaerens TaxID=10228 RepID=B3S756_TRIAD|nr:hypothetical protein TRIADDRAFT_60047 [Trichoplax adhaerens]EDV21514.1 hypothetical protein TRIADDRAFT_60047 [Trichoplax adhaerens]RDD36802.1 Leucine-rich repeat-containing protein 72 [Trichoplax sp. H2]|eukprot:XP_002116114.1 hypothetical protein TRIADDRAFT_60047 [Trichoplax adhaerens]
MAKKEETKFRQGLITDTSLIREQMKAMNLTRDVDVQQIHLGNRQLEEVSDLRRYKYLSILYLNDNKIREVAFLSRNYNLTELHLNNNNLKSLAGGLKQLHSLKVLALHCNQLTELADIGSECKYMNCLNYLNLYGNPLAHHPYYRYFVIFTIPSLKHFDRIEVSEDERKTVNEIYDDKAETIRKSIAFGKRTEKQETQMPNEDYLNDRNQRYPVYTNSLTSDRSTRREITLSETNTLEILERTREMQKLNEEAAVTKRSMKRSVMQFSMFDWSGIKKHEEIRLGDDEGSIPTITTVKIK